MNKVILSLILVVLTACSDSSSTGASDESSVSKKEEIEKSDYKLTQSNVLSMNGQSKINLDLTNLPSDDAVYITVTSDQFDNNLLSIKPYKTILYPNKGQANLTLTVTDHGATRSPEVVVSILTSDNKATEASHTMEWSQ